MKTTPPNPWAARFEHLLEREVIRLRSTVNPEPLKGLMQMNVEVACRKLEGALEELFYPSGQCLDMLEKWVGMIYAHCLTIYLDNKKYLQGINDKLSPLPSFSPPVCLTGLPGTGKTELFKALLRLLPVPSEIEVGSGYNPMPCQSYWYFTINASAAPSDLLIPFCGGKDILKNLVITGRKLAFLNGVPIFIADELQHATASSTANTRITQMLLSVGYLGIPFVFGANYSLIYRLMQRPDEDQQRLLANIDVLLPDDPESEDWIEMLTAQKRIAPDVFAFDPKKDGSAIHGYCAGIKREEKYLLLTGFRIAHKRKTKVTLDVLREAYLSSQYSPHRSRVEMLLSIALEPAQTFRLGQHERSDLRCPVALPEGALAKITLPMKRHRKAKVAENMLESSMTPEELALIRGDIQPSRKPVNEKPKGGVARRTRADSAEDLKENANWYKKKILRP
ncbi:MAG: ATP-binding protein [Zoogloeaceae bacterium]|nr:ATP-binding protein [Zoogloeaceae bacterium]